MEGEEARSNHIKPRDFQTLLFGQEYFGNDPEPYRYWHSSENKVGQNIVYYNNEDVDKYLKGAKETNKYEERKEKYEKFEEKIKDDCPAIFLYSLNHVYIVGSKVKGMDSSVVVAPNHRFSHANKWFVKTTRGKKRKRRISIRMKNLFSIFMKEENFDKHNLRQVIIEYLEQLELGQAFAKTSILRGKIFLMLLLLGWEGQFYQEDF